jgi:lipoprotein-anchoring transpeptidase ErfK/SrfK
LVSGRWRPAPVHRFVATANFKFSPQGSTQARTAHSSFEQKKPRYVLPGGQAIRYGVAVGEEAMAWSGVAQVGRMAEWPAWVPTESEKQRLGVPNYVAPGPQNPMGARALYLFEGNTDTLYRIHGTNQPEYIGQAISSGCIRMTNEDVIDLYKRVKKGAVVVVLGPHQGGWS